MKQNRRQHIYRRAWEDSGACVGLNSWQGDRNQKPGWVSYAYSSSKMINLFYTLPFFFKCEGLHFSHNNQSVFSWCFFSVLNIVLCRKRLIGNVAWPGESVIQCWLWSGWNFCGGHYSKRKVAQISWKHGLQLSCWLKIQFPHCSWHRHGESLLLHQPFASVPGVEKWLWCVPALEYFSDRLLV